MMITINDDSNLNKLNQKSPEKVLPVQEISAVQNHPEYGNDFPASAATTDSKDKPPEVFGAKDLDAAVQEINQNTQVIQRELHFNVDEDSGQTVIKVVDLSTKEVIRQIPNEEALSFARKLSEGGELKLFSEYV